MVISQQQLLEELYEHNDFFDMLVDMIPSKLYIAGNSGDDYNPKAKYHKGPSVDSKETRRAEAKRAKRAKLDPSQSQGTVETKRRLEEEKDKVSVSLKKASKKNKETPDADHRDEEPSQDTTKSLSPAQSRIEALRAKLHAKIRAQQGQRPSASSDQISKRAARRAEKRRRQQQAQQKASSSKVNTEKSTLYSLDSPSDPSQDLAALDFGRLAGLNTSTSSSKLNNYTQANKSLANLGRSQNLARLLADAQAKREKLQALQKGNEADQTKLASMQWTDTFKEADGRRIKDDPTKLKKALQRKATKKQKSQKAWKTRMQQTAASKQERQNIRRHNLQARKQGGKAGANLSKKRIVSDDTTGKDTGRRLSRAGFEGRKQDFLNGGSGKE